MALVIEGVKRSFKYKKNILDDPNPEWEPKQVLRHYSSIYPELVSATVDVPKNEKGVLIYEFKEQVGTKG